MNTIIYTATTAAIVGLWQNSWLVGAVVFAGLIYGAVGLRWILKENDRV